jgi:DNA-binding MarR family transcriptional regulator
VKAEHQLHEVLMDLVRLAGVLQPEAFGISLSQVFALHELDTDRPLSQQELADRLGLEKSTVSRLVAELERAGLLVRERDPANRRLYQLRITDAGRELHARIGSEWRHRQAGWMADMTSAEKHALYRGLTALIRTMRSQHPEE